MRQLFLNEASIRPLAPDFDGAWGRLNGFIQTYKKRPVGTFESRICSECYLGDIQLTPDMNLQTFASDTRGRNIGALLLGLTKHPYIDDGSRQVDEYLQSRFTISKDNQTIDVQGIAAAHLHDSVAIGFASETYWQNVVFTLTVTTDGNERNFDVLCVSSPEHFEAPVVKMWVEDRAEIVLVESAISCAQKTVRLRDDHGREKLLSVAARLIRCPYVVEIVNSLPFNPQERKVVRSVSNAGLVEMVLTKTDAGYGLVVRTTGRNERETRRIAEILVEEYWD